MVPLGTNRAASLPSRSAAFASRRLTVGSSPKSSSPTSASAIALRIAGVGRVIVSDLSSTYRMVLSVYIEGFRLYRTSMGGLQGDTCTCRS